MKQNPVYWGWYWYVVNWFYYIKNSVDKWKKIYGYFVEELVEGKFGLNSYYREKLIVSQS